MNRVLTKGCLAVLLSTSTILAWPTTDETTIGSGCIDLANGGSGQFQLDAVWDVDTQTQAGSIHYVDTGSGLVVDSNSMIDYSAIDSGVRGFIFQASAADYNEVRVFIADFGASDQFEIQLLMNGTIVYDQFGDLSSECGGGVAVTPTGGETPPPPTEGGKGHPDHPQHPQHPPHPNHIHGNNGVGNGIDPQPPGNPPINDGPGTGPGNPGNRGGAHK